MTLSISDAGKGHILAFRLKVLIKMRYEPKNERKYFGRAMSSLDESSLRYLCQDCEMFDPVRTRCRRYCKAGDDSCRRARKVKR